MNSAVQFLMQYEYVVLFAVVLAEQIGLPIPAAPLLLAAGALAGPERSPRLIAVLLAAGAAVVGDSLWYALGRHRGRSVLNLVCRISLEPDSCVRRTQGVFQRHGSRLLLFAKFVPGLSTTAPPLAAIVRMPYFQFLAWDAAGAVLWAGSFVGAGYLFRTQLGEVVLYGARLGWGLVVLLSGALLLYLLRKFVARRKFLRAIRMSRISPLELMNRIGNGEQVFVADLRHEVDLQIDSARIPGAVQMSPDQLAQRHPDLPRDREIVLYCSCPNEATSAHMALELHRRGITQVRPLLGGFEAWRAAGFPVEHLVDHSARRL